VQIDWFTFGAQVVNFLILIGLLKRFLYGPILEAMDRREAEITARLDEARDKRQEAERAAEQYRTLQEDLEAQRAEELAAAEKEAEERRQALIRTAREEVEYLEREWREALERERSAFLEELSERTVEETVAIARRALRDLADARLEDQSFEIFLERLHHLDGDEERALMQALQAAGDGGVTVRSAFGLTDEQRERIRRALHAHVDEVPALTTKTDEALGFGVELRVGDRKVAWTLESYLAHLLDRVRDRLDAELKVATRPDGEAKSAAAPASPNDE